MNLFDLFYLQVTSSLTHRLEHKKEFQAHLRARPGVEWPQVGVGTGAQTDIRIQLSFSSSYL